MTRALEDERYLKKRGGWYYYYRRVPTRLRPFYEHDLIRIALGTRSAEVARVRRDELAEADEDYWSQLKLSVEMEKIGEPMEVNHARRRYEIAKARALAAGFKFRSVDELADPSHIEDIVRRFLHIEKAAASDGSLNSEVIDAVLGGVEEPKVTISEAMALYQSKIALPEIVKKSPAQKRLWENTLNRSLRYFVEVIGDLAMTDIEREHAQTYFAYWNSQITPEEEEVKPMSPKTAARHFGDMRVLYNAYFKYMGDEDRPNPFRNLNFKDKRNKDTRKTPSFTNEWVRKTILVPGVFEDLTPEIVLAPLMIVETGCRPGEIINLRPQDIVLDAKIPHLIIPDREDREVKTATSVRKIPLVGVSLEAARRAPNGFTKYHDKSNAFSAAANAAYRRRGLFPTDHHVIYSFRHSFEDRMKEAGIDFELRCMLMGHKIDRPEYGTGGSLEYRRRELLKIAHPVPKNLFVAFDAAHGAS